MLVLPEMSGREEEVREFALGDTLDPEDWPAFRSQAHRMLDDMLDYTEQIRDRPVWQPIPRSVRDAFRQPMPHRPASLASVHRAFLREILPYSVGNAHPGFMGWVHGGGTPVGMLAEMLAAGLNANCGGRDHIPIEVERQIVRWVRELFGFPETASGLFVTGTSMANLIAVLVARDGRLRFRRAPPWGGRHGSIAWSPIPPRPPMDALRKLLIWPVWEAMRCASFESTGDSKWTSMRSKKPSLAIGPAAGCPSSWRPPPEPWTPARSTTCRPSPLWPAGITLWFHVDGACGALGMLAPDIAPRLHGIERADSIAFDFNKWGQVPYDAGFILVRDGALHYDTFASPAAYLRRETRGMAAGSPWPCDFGPDLSRGFRALKTWFTIKTYGAARLGAMISRTCALAQYLKQCVENEDDLELLAPVSLNIVCFRYRAENADEVNREIAADLQESGIAAPSTTSIDGRVAIRAAIVNHRTGKDDIDALVRATLAFGSARTGRL